LLQRSRFFEKGLPLRRDRDGPIQVRQRAVEILRGAGDAGGEKVRWAIFRSLGEACLGVGAGRLDLTLRKQHGGKQVMEHGIAGLAAQALFAEFARILALARIEGRGRATNDVLGAVLVHAGQIRTKPRVCNLPPWSAKAHD
jgi:hypothetical protein